MSSRWISVCRRNIDPSRSQHRSWLDITFVLFSGAQLQSYNLVLLAHSNALALNHDSPSSQKKITYSFAKDEETNILHQLGYFDQQCDFFSYFNDRRDWMEAVISHHLGLGSTNVCHVAKIEDWLRGSFNVAFPSLSRTGLTGNSLDNESYFDFLYPIAFVIVLGRGMETKSYNARLVPMHGSNRIVRMFQFPSDMGLRSLRAKLYEARSLREDIDLTVK